MKRKSPMPASSMPASSAHARQNRPANTNPPDTPFLETLFAAMCRHLFVLPGESFVEQARRWADALDFTVALKPRDQMEWLQAADVTMKQFSAIHSLILRKRRNITRKQQARHDQDFLAHAKAMHDARLRYDLLRQARSD